MAGPRLDRLLGTRRFSAADQLAFAQLSGDRNPIHLDAAAARRTQAGAPVVHGVHGLLWLLDQAAPAIDLGSVGALAAKFNRFVYLDAPVEARLARLDDDAAVVELWSAGAVATVATLSLGGEPALTHRLSSLPLAATTLGESPDAPAFEQMAGLSGLLAPAGPLVGVAEAFGALSGAIGAERVQGLASMTGVVGMACPGLHSMFSHLTLRAAPYASGAVSLAWKTARTDARVRWVVLDVEGAGWEGEVVALARQEPVDPPSMAELAGRVARDAFAGRSALVIGGSRGLGAVTAKLIAAGGGRVVVTYASGAADAAAVADEINGAHGPGVCQIRQCDVTGDVAVALAGLSPTHLYYFATPMIARQSPAIYARSALDAFLSVYVDGFAAACAAAKGQGPLTVLLPSTVFIDERPKGMTEYVMAKAAAELLAADLAKRTPALSIATPRLPRTLTDQTATVPPTPVADPVEVMLPLLLAQT